MMKWKKNQAKKKRFIRPLDLAGDSLSKILIYLQNNVIILTDFYNKLNIHMSYQKALKHYQQKD